MNIFFSQTKNQQGKSIVSTSQALTSSLCQQLSRGCSSWRCILDQTQVTQPVIGRARRGAGLLSLSTTVFPKPSDFEMNEIYSMYTKQEFCSRCPTDRNVSVTCADICVLTLATLSSQCFSSPEASGRLWTSMNIRVVMQPFHLLSAHCCYNRLGPSIYGTWPSDQTKC